MVSNPVGPPCLCSKGCVILFFAGSMVGVMSQYFGEPIQCDFKVRDGMFNNVVQIDNLSND